MSDRRATLEVIAPSVEEAIAKGLSDLGLPEEAVEVEILDGGSRGLFGLGSRQARVRLAVKSPAQMGTETPAAPAAEPMPAQTGAVAEAPQAEEEREPEIPQKVAVAQAEGEEEQDLRVARETVTELLEKMKIRARVTAHYGEMDEERGRIPIHIDIHGNDLSILIGRRAETLNALQYIAGLIVSKELDRSASLIVDVEGYRVRREGQLRQLARRMADQALKTNRRQILEPMPASERRIIHMELRDHPDVKTESIGEEPRRKVTIIPRD